MDFGNFIKKTLVKKRGYRHYNYRTEFNGKRFKLYHYGTCILELKMHPYGIPEPKIVSYKYTLLPSDAGSSGYAARLCGVENVYCSRTSIGEDKLLNRWIRQHKYEVFFQNGKRDIILDYEKFMKADNILILNPHGRKDIFLAFEILPSVKRLQYKYYYFSERKQALFPRYCQKPCARKKLRRKVYEKYIIASMI